MFSYTLNLVQLIEHSPLSWKELTMSWGQYYWRKTLCLEWSVAKDVKDSKECICWTHAKI